MWKIWPFDNMPPVARWLFFIAVFFSIVPPAVDGSAETLHGHPPLAIWQAYVTQGIAFLLWGIAFLITSVVLQRRKPQPSLFMQPSLWVGLLFLAVIPDGTMLALRDSHVLSEGPVTGSIILGSVIASLFCLVLAVYFWWRKRRLVAR
jgi:hypothetical protein